MDLSVAKAAEDCVASELRQFESCEAKKLDFGYILRPSRMRRLMPHTFSEFILCLELLSVSFISLINPAVPIANTSSNSLLDVVCLSNSS